LSNQQVRQIGAAVEHLFAVDEEKAAAVPPTTLVQEKLLEPQHLQEWVIAHPEVLGEDVLVITAEYDRWADAEGTPARDRLDVLALEASGRLVVVELKRSLAKRDVHLQAITYAALVSRFSVETLAQAHQAFLAGRGTQLSVEECRIRLLEHAGEEWDVELLRRPRLVIVAEGFPKQVTHSVVWLSEMGLDIDLLQVSLWRVGEQLVAGFGKLYPTPEVEEFTLAPARAESSEVAQKLQERKRSQNAVHVLVNAALLPDGTRLRMVPDHGAPVAVRERIAAWVSEDPRRAMVTWRNTTANPLRWDADGQWYSPTGLAEHVFFQVAGRTPPGIQGTTWWVLDAASVPDGADPGRWADLSLVALSQRVDVLLEDLDGVQAATE
jgi:hypothetical protein